MNWLLTISHVNLDKDLPGVFIAYYLTSRGLLNLGSLYSKMLVYTQATSVLKHLDS